MTYGLNILASKIGDGNRARGFHAQSEFMRGQESSAESDAELGEIQANLANYAVVKLALVAGEALEGVEEVRSGRGLDEIYYSGGVQGPLGLFDEDSTDYHDNLRKPEGAPVEVADALIRCLDWFAEFAPDLNVDDVVDEKLAYNSTRGKLHGGKAF